MYNIDIYNKKADFDNMVYSVDMLRLKTYIRYIKFNELEFLLNSVYKERIKKFWISDRPMCFHYNYSLEFDDCSFYFGFMHNSENVNYNREDLEYNFTIEFNPNKCRDNNLILHILNNFGNWYLKSLDLAIDIPINILDLIVDISGRRKMQTLSYGGDNIYYAFGKGDGRVKIYNKKNESKLNIVGHLTRVEITKEYDDYPIMKTKLFKFDNGVFPIIYLNQYVFSFSDITTKDKTTMALLYAVQSGFPLKDLTRRYREKIKELLEGGSKIKFNAKTATDVILQTIYFYFVRRGSKQVIF